MYDDSLNKQVDRRHFSLQFELVESPYKRDPQEPVFLYCTPTTIAVSSYNAAMAISNARPRVEGVTQVYQEAIARYYSGQHPDEANVFASHFACESVIEQGYIPDHLGSRPRLFS